MGLVDNLVESIKLESLKRSEDREDDANVWDVLLERIESMSVASIARHLDELGSTIVGNGDGYIDISLFFDVTGEPMSRRAAIAALQRTLLYDALEKRLIKSNIPIGNQGASRASSDMVHEIAEGDAEFRQASRGR